MAARNPSTPDCAIRGCTLAVVRLGMCRKHAELAPPRAGFDTMIAVWSATFKAASREHRKAQKFVRARLREQAASGR
jgi:hypothetical protein